MENDYLGINKIKKEMITFVLALKDLGLISDMSFLNNLVKLHDVFIDSMLSSIENDVKLFS